MFRSKIKELKKITWTPPFELAKNVGTVIWFSAFFAIVLFLLDIGISAVAEAIIKLL